MALVLNHDPLSPPSLENKGGSNNAGSREDKLHAVFVVQTPGLRQSIFWESKLTFINLQNCPGCTSRQEIRQVAQVDKPKIARVSARMDHIMEAEVETL